MIRAGVDLEPKQCFLSLSISLSAWLIFIILEDPLYFETSKKLDTELEPFHITYNLNFINSSST